MVLPILYTVSALDSLSFVMTLTAQHFQINDMGGSPMYVGFLGSTCALISLFWSPVVGSLSDNIGRKNALLQCFVVCLIGNLVAAWTQSLSVFFISRLFTAFGTQIATLLKSLTDDKMASKDEKMATINKMQGVSGFCIIIGSLTAGYLSEYENGSYYIFLIISIMFVVNIGLVSLIKDNPKLKKGTPLKISAELRRAGSRLVQIDWPKYWQLFVIKLIIDFVMCVFRFQFGLILSTRFAVTGKSFAYIFASTSVVSMLTSLAMTKVKHVFYQADESGLKRLLHGSVLLLVTYIWWGLGPNLLGFLALLVPLTVGRVLFESTFTEVLLSRASPQEKGSVLGAFESALNLGGLVAPLVSGIVADNWGYNMTFMLCAIPLFACTLLTLVQHSKAK